MTYKKDKCNYFNVRLSDTQIYKIDTLCINRKMSRSDVIRDILDYYFRTFKVEEVYND